MTDHLTHWGRVTHICVGKLTIIGSDYGLSPGRRHAIIWTNARILLIGPLVTNFSEILIEIHTFSFKKMLLKMSSGKWRPLCQWITVPVIFLCLLFMLYWNLNIYIYIVIYSNFEFEFNFDLSPVVANDIVSEWGMLRVSHCWGQYAVVVSGRLFRTYRAMRWMCLLQLPGRSFMHHWSDSGAACWCGAWAHSAVREITKSSRTFFCYQL